MVPHLRNELKFPPIKRQKTKIPNEIVWFSDKNPWYYDFAMCSISKPFKMCKMYCSKYNIVNDNGVFPSLMINMIKSTPPKQGLGTKMLNIAKKFSEQIGCEGRFVLKSVSLFTPEELPHIFYRKCGFDTLDKNVNKKLDYFISKNKKATKEDFRETMMYYFPKEVNNVEEHKPKCKGFLGILTKFIDKITKKNRKL